jgi:hypothetical protein
MSLVSGSAINGNTQALPAFEGDLGTAFNY